MSARGAVVTLALAAVAFFGLLAVGRVTRDTDAVNADAVYRAADRELRTAADDLGGLVPSARLPSLRREPEPRAPEPAAPEAPEPPPEEASEPAPEPTPDVTPAPPPPPEPPPPAPPPTRFFDEG